MEDWAYPMGIQPHSDEQRLVEAVAAETSRVRCELLDAIKDLPAGRLGHNPEAAHVLLAVRAAIDRICPEAGK